MSRHRLDGDGSIRLPSRFLGLVRQDKLFLLLLAFLITLVAGEARAHAVLLSTTPAADSALAASPKAIELNFNEPVQILALRILDAEAHDRTPQNPPANADGRVTLQLGTGLPEGRYLVSWRVTSLDGHVVGSTFAFAVGTGASAVPPAAAPSRGFPAWELVALQALSRVTLLLAAGVALFRVLMPAPIGLHAALCRAIRRLSVAALIAHLLLTGADGASRAGLGLPGLFAIDAWRAAYDTPTVWLQVITLIGLLVLIMTCSTLLQSIGALLSLATMAATGHVLALLPDGIGQALMVGHGLVAALWIGAIGPLRMALATDAGPTTAALFRRFQSYGAVAVLGVLGSGTTMAWLLLPRLSDLWLSDYGLRLSAKLATVGVMLFVALINRAWLTRAALAGSSRMRQRLVTILRLDLAVAILAVVLAAGLSLGPPPLPSLKIILPGGPYPIQLTLSPGKVGDNIAEIVLLPPQAAATEPKGVDLRILAPEIGIEAAVYQAHPVAPGRYRVTGLPLWMGGRWQMQVGVLVDDFTKLHWETTVILEQ